MTSIRSSRSSDPMPGVRAPEILDRFPCKHCGADLSFRPGTSELVCGYCGQTTPIDTTDEGIEELDYQVFLERLRREEPTEQVQTVRCQACQSETDRPDHLDSFRCVFCGSNAIAGTSQERLIKPRSLLPFGITKESAHQRFRKWIAGHWLAPGDLKRFAGTGGRLDGAYLPFWTYDSVTISRYQGQRGDDYWVTKRVTVMQNGKRVTRNQRVRKTRWRRVSGTVQNGFDDVLVVGSKTLPQPEQNDLMPWDLAELTPFQNEFLAGFRTERYTIGLEEAFEFARQRMDDSIRAAIRRDIGGDHQRISSVDTNYLDVTFKHLLLPVWISAYRYRGKVYRFLVNARSGEVRGAYPKSAWKIAGLILLGLIVLAVVLLMLALR